VAEFSSKTLITTYQTAVSYPNRSKMCIFTIVETPYFTLIVMLLFVLLFTMWFPVLRFSSWYFQWVINCNIL